jgi:hypothetical protein
VRELLRDGGVAVVELETAAIDFPDGLVRFELGPVVGPWFRLSCVTVGEIAQLARATGFRCTRVWTDGARSFAALRREEAA